MRYAGGFLLITAAILSVWAPHGAHAGLQPQWFGYSVAVDDDTAVVGAPFPSIWNGVHVFVRVDGAWIHQAKLESPLGPFSSFGWSVALDGDTAVVGEWEGISDGVASGAAYVFTRAGGVWNLQVALPPADPLLQMEFGKSVDVDGDTALIGANRDDDNGVNSGSVYVFTRIGGVWTQQTKLLASDGAEGRFFGRDVALDGDTAIVSQRDDGSGTFMSYAYVFVRANDVWTEQAMLLPADWTAGDDFDSVSVAGDTAVIGARGDDDNGDGSGSAYVFNRVSGVWSEQAKLLPADGSPGQHFGVSTAVDGDTAVVGTDEGTGGGQGSAYVFTRTGSVWMGPFELTPTGGEPGGSFGFSVAIHDGTALIGAPNEGVTSVGSAYVFVATGDEWTQEAELEPVNDDGEPVPAAGPFGWVLLSLGLLASSTYVCRRRNRN